MMSPEGPDNEVKEATGELDQKENNHEASNTKDWKKAKHEESEINPLDKEGRSTAKSGVQFGETTEIIDDREDGTGYQSIDLGNGGSHDNLYPWDIKFPQARRKEKHVDESKIAIAILKFAKILTLIIVFLLVLGSGVFSKIILLLMSSQLSLGNRTVAMHIEDQDRIFKVTIDQLEMMGWYWSIYFVLLLPEALLFLKSLRVLLFKSYKKPSGKSFFLVFLIESIHTVGLALLVFEIFPKIDVIRAVMLTNSFCTIPSVILFLSRDPEEKLYRLKVSADITCMLVQLCGLIVWSIQSENGWLVTVTGICVSIGWWETFVDNKSKLGIMVGLRKIVNEMTENNTRIFTYFIISMWKSLIYFGIMLVVVALRIDGKMTHLLPNFVNCFNVSHPVRVVQVWRHEVTISVIRTDYTLLSEGMLPIYLSAIQMSTSLIAFWAGRYACRLRIQEFSFALPTTLTVPIAVFLLSTGCLVRNQNLDFLTDHLPQYVFWRCPDEHYVFDFLWSSRGFLWIPIYISQIWCTSHIWTSCLIPLMPTKKLFVLPLYNGAVIDQSLVLNRIRHPRKDDEKQHEKKEEKKTYDFEDLYDSVEGVHRKQPGNERMKIYACATMWHETKEEMVQILKSIMRMDKALTEKSFIGSYKNTTDYDFETHIFFDDAFYFDKKKNNVVCNTFVKDLINVMNKAASYIYPASVRQLAHPIKYVTPYGGRLRWKLPGITEVIVHLKNKDMIRHKKRWSQVMYMYYLLGYKLTACTEEEREQLEKNTFILALDGDIDFKPPAVTRLVELMKDENLGAACGRIHPVGNGLIVWYQKFEYAVGHWLQKATEHMIGCVLCSPGCFSLFRGQALMKVMHTYASKAERALEYVQFDQGEDRWLCTLILKQGYRIQYSAASDAYTHCPETFGEFYTQRRRWGPSTMANIMDLLMDYKHTVKTNNNISLLYIMYQLMIMVGTILGPGTIFLMVVGSMVTALRISNVYALLCNLIPVSLFIISCFFTKNEIQIIFAQLLSALYALLMMAVLVGTIIELQADGWITPSGIFLIAIASSFIIAAIIHPYEFLCVIHGFLYFMCVPAMYLLLTVYSLINLNVVSWGTREDPIKKAEEEALKATNKSSKKSSGALESFTNFFRMGNMSRLCNCSLCSYEKETGEEAVALLDIKSSLGDIQEKVTDVRKGLVQINVVPEEPTSEPKKVPYQEVKQQEKPHQPRTIKRTAPDLPKHEERPFWVTEGAMKSGKIDRFEENEKDFFSNLIEKYLKPLDSSPTTEQRVAAELINLRNNVVFGFLMFNGMFILIVFLLEMNKDSLFINWPFGGEFNVTFIPTQNKVLVDRKPQQLAPIGLVFGIFFGVIIAVQFVAMLMHRFETLSHILASTTIDCRFDMIEEFDVAADIMDEDDEEDEDDFPSEVHVDKPEAEQRSKVERRKSLYKKSYTYQHAPKTGALKDHIMSTFEKKKEQDKNGILDRRQSKYIRRMSRAFMSEPISEEAEDRRDSTPLQVQNGGIDNKAFDMLE